MSEKASVASEHNVARSAAAPKQPPAATVTVEALPVRVQCEYYNKMGDRCVAKTTHAPMCSRHRHSKGYAKCPTQNCPGWYQTAASKLKVCSGCTSRVRSKLLRDKKKEDEARRLQKAMSELKVGDDTKKA